MPCLSYDTDDFRDSYNSYKEQLKKDKAQLEAALCTALTFIEKTGRTDNYIAATDWKEAGITPEQVRTWWEDHKEKDRIRRDDERKSKEAAEAYFASIAARILELQAKTWSELTKDEIKFLSTHVKK
jgi:roadblock/LC7 domain-containing protein